MSEAMDKFGGIGLSANQVGLPYRMFVMEAQQANIIKWENEVFKYGTQSIGISEDQVIKWLKDNKDIFALLKNQLNKGEEVEMDLVEQKTKAVKTKK